MLASRSRTRLAGLLAGALIAVGLAPGAQAQQYTNNFDAGDAQGAALFGTASLTGGRLRLTQGVPGQSGAVVLPVIAEQVDAFNMSFTYRFDRVGGSTFAADGISFNLGVVPNGIIPGAAENGPGNGLTVTIDLFDWDDNGFVSDAGVKLFYNGVQLAGVSNLHSIFSGGINLNYSISLLPGGQVQVIQDGVALFTQVVPFVPQPGQRFSIGARTGGSFAEQYVDNFNVEPFYRRNSCAEAVAIRGDGTYGYGYGTEGLFPVSCTGTTSRGAYFAWLAETTGRVTVTSVGTTLDDNVITVQRGAGPCPGTFGEIACNDDAFLGNNSRAAQTEFDAVAGATYLIRVGIFGFTAPANFASNKINITTVPASTCIRDINGDGNVDPDDLSDYIGFFFSGCP